MRQSYKREVGQYFANYHFCTPLCSKRNGNLAIKNFLEQKFAKSSLINLAPNTWFNEKNAIKKGCAELVFWYCPYYALWLWFYEFFHYGSHRVKMNLICEKNICAGGGIRSLYHLSRYEEVQELQTTRPSNWLR